MLSEVFMLKCKETSLDARGPARWAQIFKEAWGWTFQEKWSLWCGFFEWRISNRKKYNNKAECECLARGWSGLGETSLATISQYFDHDLLKAVNPDFYFDKMVFKLAENILKIRTILPWQNNRQETCVLKER